MTMQSLFVTRKVFKEGDVIFRFDEKRDVAYIIEKGQVSLFGPSIESNHTSHVTIGDGEIFGESAILEGGHRTATAVAETDTEVFILSRDILKERMNDLDPLVQLIISMLLEKYGRSRMADVGLIPHENLNKVNKENLLVAPYKEQKKVVLQELQLEQELRRALECREFKPYLQPIVDLTNGKIKGYETLVRWHHPVKGTIFPNDFIPLAERTNVVGMIDQCMLEAACDIVPRFYEIAGEDANDMFISVNLSGANFKDESVIERVLNTLSKTDFEPKHIKLEITESALVNDADQAVRILSKLKQIGVRIALDDFGTGYSSLGYLHKFQIDSLKIDRSFVQEIGNSDKALDIVKAVVGLAKTFKLDVIAEGIESIAETEILKKLGCEYGQGYYFGRPIESDKALAELKEIYENGHAAENIIKFKAAEEK